MPLISYETFRQMFLAWTFWVLAYFFAETSAAKFLPKRLLPKHLLPKHLLPKHLLPKRPESSSYPPPWSSNELEFSFFYSMIHLLLSIFDSVLLIIVILVFWVAVNRSNFSGRKDRGRTFWSNCRDRKECGRILSYLLYGSVASLPSPSSNIEAWPYGTSLRFASLLHSGH